MKTRQTAVLLLLPLCLFVYLVPSTDAASLANLPFYDDLSETEPLSSALDKRSNGVDAWSICPPHMTDVDCFYAYLRVYARLRKAAEESDRVSMRNIGKRSSLTSSSEFGRAGTELGLLELCPERLSPMLCYKTAKRVYLRALAGVLK